MFSFSDSVTVSGVLARFASIRFPDASGELSRSGTSLVRRAFLTLRHARPFFAKDPLRRALYRYKRVT